jgi:helicase MOV-10
MVCEHCRKIIESSAYDAHVEDHMRQQRLDDIRVELDEAANDKEGVTVSGRTGIDFGILDAETPVEVYISVTSTAAAVSLRSSRMRSSGRGDEHGLKYVVNFFLTE